MECWVACSVVVSHLFCCHCVVTRCILWDISLLCNVLCCVCCGGRYLDSSAVKAPDISSIQHALKVGVVVGVVVVVVELPWTPEDNPQKH